MYCLLTLSLLDLVLMKFSEFLDSEEQGGYSAHAILLVGAEIEMEEAVGGYVERRGYLINDISNLSPADESGKKGEIKAAAVKEFLHEMRLTPHGAGRVGIIRSASRLNLAAANMLLKSLEEPSKSATFIICAETESLPLTIKSRCRIYRLQSLSQDHTFSYSAILSGSLVSAFRTIDEIIKDQKVAGFLDELTFMVRGKLISEKNKALALYLQEIEEAKKRIKNNANVKLVLENLIISARGLIK